MTIPGIMKVRVLDCASLPAYLALEHRAGLSVSVSVPYSEPDAYHVRLEMTRTDAMTETAELRFRVRERLWLPFAAGFVVKTAGGRQYLIGTREDRPTVEQTVVTAAPDSDTTDTEVTVRLTAHSALLPIGSLDETQVLLTEEPSSGGGSDPAAVVPLTLATQEECAAALAELIETIEPLPEDN